MASEVDLCNVALAHIGDIGNISSLSEFSTQAQYCRVFYPLARDSILEMHPWGFASVRATLAAVSSAIPEWQYAYAAPANMMKALAVHSPTAASDYSAPALPNAILPNINALRTYGAYTTQPFIIEVDANGQDVIYTNQVSATLRYTHRVTDTNKFTPLFDMALTWHLASLLAGPILKGKEGAAQGKQALAMVQHYLGQAQLSDANSSRDTVQQNVAWMAGR